jgi:FtsP/CotA-like multicopper oxidase with cupredoxin domain
MRGGLAGALLCLVPLLLPTQAFAQTDVCSRPAAGSIVKEPTDLYSDNGVLQVAFTYNTMVDQYDRTLFCFVTTDGVESPTLHLKPGDTLELSVTNAVQNPDGAPAEVDSGAGTRCGAKTMTLASVNVHFHGLNVSPTCHSDEVVHTLINSGQTFTYKIKIPKNEPPGLYWYHPHVHGIADTAVQGGASGAIVIDGIENLQPIVKGLPHRVLIVRDQPLAFPPQPKAKQITPFWDVSLNYVPVPFPTYQPGIIKMHAGEQEFWRVVNASADTTLDLQVLYDGVAQPLQIVGFDGVPTGSQDGKHQGTVVTQTDIFIPAAGRAEFVVTGPSATVKKALFWTKGIDTGPLGDNDTPRPLAEIKTTTEMRWLPPSIERTAPPTPQRFAGLTDAMVTAHRHLYFSEMSTSDQQIPGRHHAPAEQMRFFITVDGQDPRQYYADEPPAITTTQGAVEDWTIENRAAEIHEFHMHQIHYQLLAINGVPIPPDQRQFYDTHKVDFWTGTGPYPSIKVRMDFRGAVAGEFVYHCHLLAHEDGGMMANILVQPKGTKLASAAR